MIIYIFLLSVFNLCSLKMEDEEKTISNATEVEEVDAEVQKVLYDVIDCIEEKKEVLFDATTMETEEKSVPSTSGTSEVKDDDTDIEEVLVDMIDELKQKKEIVFDTTSLYIIIDTNILMHEIDLLDELKDTPLNESGPPHIYVPWIVVQELDKLKSNKRHSKLIKRCAASKAIKYLYEVLKDHPRFHGQSPLEAEESCQRFDHVNEDDKVLNCCLVLREKNEGIESKKKMKTYKPEESKSAAVNFSRNINPDIILKRKLDLYRCDIHTIMSHARLLLKDVLSNFIKDEVLKACGNLSGNLVIETNFLKGILDGIKRCWKTLFSKIFNKDDLNMFEFLLKKLSRPGGFWGDQDDCLVILSVIEKIFDKLKQHNRNLVIPVSEIENYKINCSIAFATFYEAEVAVRKAEAICTRCILKRNWTAINYLCGTFLDLFKINNRFKYDKITKISHPEIQRIWPIFYSAIHNFKYLFTSIRDNIQARRPIKKLVIKLANHLTSFVPSLQLPCGSFSYPLFNETALGRYLYARENRRILKTCIIVIELCCNKMDQVSAHMALQ